MVEAVRWSPVTCRRALSRRGTRRWVGGSGRGWSNHGKWPARLSNVEIASRLFISEATAKTHVALRSAL